jgi:hypothetical protein
MFIHEPPHHTHAARALESLCHARYVLRGQSVQIANGSFQCSQAF